MRIQTCHGLVKRLGQACRGGGGGRGWRSFSVSGGVGAAEGTGYLRAGREQLCSDTPCNEGIRVNHKISIGCCDIPSN